MRILALLSDLIWAAYLDENEWWLRSYDSSDQEGFGGAVAP